MFEKTNGDKAVDQSRHLSDSIQSKAFVEFVFSFCQEKESTIQLPTIKAVEQCFISCIKLRNAKLKLYKIWEMQFFLCVSNFVS